MVGSKVIGGEFEIEIKAHYHKRNAVPEGVNTYSSGRSAFYNILAYLKERKKIKTVLFPDYLCESLYVMAEANQLKFEFYAVDEQLEPIWADVRNRYDDSKAILLINYFGLMDHGRLVECLRSIDHEMIVILDNVQAPYAMIEETDADFTFSSFRKALPVVDGSWVKTKNAILPQPEVVNEFAQYKIAASCLKTINTHHLFNDEIYLDLYHRGEMLIDKDYMTDMTQFSKDILADIEWDKFSAQRKRNAEYVLGSLKELGISPIIPVRENCVPLFIPIRIENRDVVRKNMFANNIFMPVHWPVEEKYKKIMRRGADLAAKELSIIIDQRYTVKDMERILDILERYV